MGIFSNIENALNTRLASLAGLPAVAWPNTKYIPTENTLFIRPTLLPAATNLDTLGGGELHAGIYQIDVFVPLEKGINTLNNLLDNIASLYRDSKTLTADTNIIFVQAVGRGRTERQEAWFTSFVEINFICHS